MTRSRTLLLAVALLAISSLAFAGALGPAVLGPPQPTPDTAEAPIAQASPTPSPADNPAGEPTAPPVQPSPSPSPPRAALPPDPPGDEIYPYRPGSWMLPTPTPDGSEQTGRGGSPVAVPPGSGVVATRVVVPSRNIDLPVVSGELRVRGNRGNYPLCDVAQYMTIFNQPGEEGTTYIYAHAQRGMFLPLLRASRRNSGAEMIGQRVEVYTSDAKLHIYEIYRVKRHSTDLNIGFNVRPGEQRLILQTSEGPHGHRPVLQVAAQPVEVVESTPEEAMPTPKPRACLPPR